MSHSASAPTPSVEHWHRVDPTAGPIQLSKTHPNIVNYAISAGGVLLGLALIGGFALFVRCNKKRRKHRVLEAQIDARINDHALPRVLASRASSFAKDMSTCPRDQAMGHPLPLLTASRLASVSSSSVTLPRVRARATCIRASDQRVPCGCSECLLGRPGALMDPPANTGPYAPSIARAPSVTRSMSRSRSPSPRPTVRYSPAGSRFPRASGVGADSPRATPGRGTANGTPRTGRSPATTPRTRAHNDENAHRAAAIRTNPVVPRGDFSPREWDAWASAAAASHHVGMGIMTATSTGTLGCPSPATPSLGFSSPKTQAAIGNTYGSPVLSDDAGATVLATPPPHLSLGSMGSLGLAGGTFTRSATGSSFGSTGGRSITQGALSSLDNAYHVGYLGPCGDSSGNKSLDLTHVQLSPLTGSESGDAFVSPRGSPHLGQQAHVSSVPAASKATEVRGDLQTHGSAGSQEKWFTEVDWFADDGPLGQAYCEPSDPASSSVYPSEPQSYGGYTDHAGYEVAV
ncbi:hypothetical protein BD413DRAFT_506318 [Trametes elegans]|nr:hypothetical protein BD413DRAFT_506318 [Trametes elegans]